MSTIRIPSHYYQHFDADLTLDVPGEGYGGWQKEELEFSLERTAVVVMHAWDTGSPKEFPGEYRAVEYIPRAEEICRTVFPPLLQCVRSSPLRLFHVVGGGDYYKELSGYRSTVELAGPEPASPPRVDSGPVIQKLRKFRSHRVSPGEHNLEDVHRCFAEVDFADQARPLEGEPIAENAHQLGALCVERGINHLIYMGFALNWCVLMSPGGMLDMSRRGVMCSVIRQATTAVENRETARKEWCKDIGLWRVALAFGFVFDLDDMVGALSSCGNAQR